MKAVQIVNPSEMKVVELEKPTVGAGEVLVRIKYVGFCGSDLNTFLGRNPMVKLPDRKSTRLNSSHIPLSRMPSSA